MTTYGLIGYPLGHSFSKAFFSRKFAAEKMDAEYVNFETGDVRELKNIVHKTPSLCGLNVTIPYKTAIIPLLDEIDDEAHAIGAVNVIQFIRDHKGELKMKGFNSDVIGFVNSIRPLLNEIHRKALILGTGGASKAVFHGLQRLGIEAMFVSRGKHDGCITYDEITPQLIENHTVIVNTTPLGMFPHTEGRPNIPYNLLTPSHLLYDLVYNPEQTLFMQKGRERGAIVKNGLEMLILQAEESWRIWNSDIF
ncbi:MAG: shikimate dehydrogenase [Tannerella sp.]|jgi:shikimate dehydrogenase|nr:shikimate dehydrogenase [Tannerella sp.]